MQVRNPLLVLGALLIGGTGIALRGVAGSPGPDTIAPDPGSCAAPAPAPDASAGPTILESAAPVADLGDRATAAAGPEVTAAPDGALALGADREADPLAGFDLGGRPDDPFHLPLDPLARADADNERLASWYAGVPIGDLVRQELRLRRIVNGDLERFALTPVQQARVLDLLEAGQGLTVEHQWLVGELVRQRSSDPDGRRWIAPEPLASFVPRVREADHEELLELRWRLERQVSLDEEHAIQVLHVTGRFTRKVELAPGVIG